MQINSFSDYTLRILMYLALAGDRLVSNREIAETYGLSIDHLAKASQLLTREKYVHAVRGRGGGMRLAKAPSEISIGEILRLTEAGSGLVECMRAGPIDCILAPVCGLAPILAEANDAFFSLLDGRTLADALPKPQKVRTALGLADA
jgi:Rrf2 family transcriptional regulator, nitric oxide-sensitive transcriptional repressor